MLSNIRALQMKQVANTNLKKSIDRAIDLIGTPNDYEKYISIKIKPAQGGCCCFHCWPETWTTINRHIYPYGPLKDEGDVLIGKNNERFVLECHESGPEIIVYLSLGTASILLVKSVIDLITTLLKALQNEHHRHSANFKITKRYQIKDRVEEEEIMELEFPLDKDIIKKLNGKIRSALKKEESI